MSRNYFTHRNFLYAFTLAMDLWIKNDAISLKANANKLPHKGKQSSFPLGQI